jgi:hypothetical protein
MNNRSLRAKEADKRPVGGRGAEDGAKAAGAGMTLREQLAKNYQELITNKKLKAAAKKRFPHITYGEARNKEPGKVSKSFPAGYKRYFFKLVKNIIIAANGKKTFAKVPASLVMTVGAREVTTHDPVLVESKNARL